MDPLDLPTWLFNKQLTHDTHQAELSIPPTPPQNPLLPPPFPFQYTALPNTGTKNLATILNFSFPSHT